MAQKNESAYSTSINAGDLNIQCSNQRWLLLIRKHYYKRNSRRFSMSVLELNGRVFDASTTGTLTLTGEGGAATTDVTQGLAKALVTHDGQEHIASRASFNLASLNRRCYRERWINTTTAFSSKDTVNRLRALHSRVLRLEMNTITWLTCTATQVKSYTGSDATLIRFRL